MSERKSYTKLPFKIFHSTCRAPMIRSGDAYLICAHYKGKWICNERRNMRIDAIMLAIYEAMLADMDSIWQEWKREVHVMNKALRQRRNPRLCPR